MQVSYSETFNIVGADQISMGVPLLGSKEIPWIPEQYTAEPNDLKEIIQGLHEIYKNPIDNVLQLQYSLTKYTEQSKRIWRNYFASPAAY